MKKVVVLAVVLSLVMAVSALTSEAEVSVTQDLTPMPLAFTENQGQWDQQVRFRADARGATMWFAGDGAYYQFTRRVESEDGQTDPADAILDRLDREPDRIETMMIKASFVGANLNPAVRGEGLLDYKCNYFFGNDPAGWRTDVANYTAIIYEQVYPGIDLKYFGSGKAMEYDFIVSPGADPSRIKIQYEGVESVSVNKNGQLVVKTEWGQVIEQRPVVYQLHNDTRMPLDGRYSLIGNNTFGFALGVDYDPTLPLVIDPVLTYSTYLGGSGSDGCYNMAAYGASPCVTGITSSTDFPILNPVQPDQGGQDAFATRFLSDGTPIYSTYLGGSALDCALGIAVDVEANAYVTGYTSSADFPILNPYQTYQAPNDVFVTKLDRYGGLVYSTYLGGSNNDVGMAITTDGGSVYLTGETYSTDFPTVNPYQINPGGRDVFVTKVGSAGNSLIYSTYLGGGGELRDDDNMGYGIAVDASGAAYVTGVTESANFPTLNPYQGTYQGGLWDVFVTKLNRYGSGLIYSTYLGGNGEEWSWDITVDASGVAYVGGGTYSTDFPTLNAYQAAFQGGAWDGFVTKLSSSGNALVYSTYLGGSGSERVRGGIVVDGAGTAYVTGTTSSPDFPVLEPFQGSLLGSDDVFVTRLGSSGSNLIFSSYLGGSSIDYGLGIALGVEEGSAYLAGWTSSTDFPTVNAYQSTLAGSFDVFVTLMSDMTCCQIRGDIDHDGALLPTDAAYFVNWLWRGGPEPPCLEEADVNGDQSVDPQDCIYFVNYMWRGGPAPVPCP